MFVLEKTTNVLGLVVAAEAVVRVAVTVVPEANQEVAVAAVVQAGRTVEVSVGADQEVLADAHHLFIHPRKTAVDQFRGLGVHHRHHWHPVHDHDHDRH